MILILTVVLIVCMLLWLFACLPATAIQNSVYRGYYGILPWICVAILCYFVIGEGGHIALGR